MIKKISSMIAKKWLSENKTDLGKTEYMALKWIDVYKDLSLYVFFYILFLLIMIIGIPLLILFLTHYGIGWTILTFLVSLIFSVIITFKLIINIISDIKKDAL